MVFNGLTFLRTNKYGRSHTDSVMLSTSSASRRDKKEEQFLLPIKMGQALQTLVTIGKTF
jgi:hypothetical protein